MLENPNNTAQNLGISITNNNLTLQAAGTGISTGSCNLTLLANASLDQWYDLSISVGANGQATVSVFSETDRETYHGSCTFSIPSGQQWRFAQSVTTNQVYLDDYQESGPFVSTYHYDEVGVPNGKGQRTSVSNPNVSINWQYTGRGQVNQATYSNIMGMNGSRVFNWTYDLGDQVSTVSLPSLTNPTDTNPANRETLTYAYDTAQRATSMFSSQVGYFASNVQYNALGQTTSQSYGDGTSGTRSYSGPMQRLSNLKISKGSLPSLFDRSYTYDSIGNVKTITSNAGDFRSGQTSTFNYDQRDRLVYGSASGTDQNGGYSNSYQYDALGNLTYRKLVA